MVDTTICTFVLFSKIDLSPFYSRVNVIWLQTNSTFSENPHFGREERI